MPASQAASASEPKSPGRPKRAETACVTFGVRLSDREHADIAAAAARLNVSMTALMRTSALITARGEVALLPQEAVAINRAQSTLGGVHRGVVQLLRFLHSGGIAGAADLAPRLAQLETHVEDLAKALSGLVRAHRRRSALARFALADPGP